MSDYKPCPVCCYAKLPAGSIYHEICPQCGTEFGYNDAFRSHQELRRRWIDGGSKWHSKRRSPADAD